MLFHCSHSDRKVFTDLFYKSVHDCAYTVLFFFVLVNVLCVHEFDCECLESVSVCYLCLLCKYR